MYNITLNIINSFIICTITEDHAIWETHGWLISLLRRHFKSLCPLITSNNAQQLCIPTKLLYRLLPFQNSLLWWQYVVGIQAHFVKARCKMHLKKKNTELKAKRNTKCKRCTLGTFKKMCIYVCTVIIYISHIAIKWILSKQTCSFWSGRRQVNKLCFKSQNFVGDIANKVEASDMYLIFQNFASFDSQIFLSKHFMFVEEKTIKLRRCKLCIVSKCVSQTWKFISPCESHFESCAEKLKRGVCILEDLIMTVFASFILLTRRKKWTLAKTFYVLILF